MEVHYHDPLLPPMASLLQGSKRQLNGWRHPVLWLSLLGAVRARGGGDAPPADP